MWQILSPILVIQQLKKQKCLYAYLIVPLTVECKKLEGMGSEKKPDPTPYSKSEDPKDWRYVLL